MYRALYDFNSPDGQSLSFKAEERFTVMDSSDQYWALVQDGRGHVGYVPANYLTKENVVESEVIQSIDRAIDAIHHQVTLSGHQYTHEQKSNLRKLSQHRKNMIEHYRREKGGVSGGQVGALPAASSHQMASNEVKSGNQPAKPPTSLINKGDTRRSSKRTAPPPPPRNPAPSSSTVLSPTSPQSPQAPPGKCLVEHHPQPTVIMTTPTTPNTNKTKKALIKQSSPSPKAKRKTSFESLTPSPRRSSSGNVAVSESLALDLVELVRRNTGLSHDKSKVAVATVLTHLRDNVGSLKGPMDVLIHGIYKGDMSPMEVSHDAKRLKELFAEMSACKEDSQQRSWALHEDETFICENLEEMLSILTNADPQISREMIAQDSYNAVHTLVLYYQMETRVSIRMLLLLIFAGLCSLDCHVISELLTSVLPLELARDMQTDTRDTKKLRHSAVVLTMIFSRGEAVPIHHYDHLSRLFISYLLDSIESPPIEWGAEEEDIIDLFIHLLLAFNLHFEMPSDNPVMAVLADYGTAKTFTEKLMLLVNRGDDPVRMFDYEPQAPDSLMKFMADIYSCPETAGLLYTNDAMVLLDIITRQLSDLCAGDKMRTEYLSLVHLIFKNSDYSEHQHRRADLELLFQRISEEPGADSDMDRMIVRQIYREFSELFSLK